MEIKITVATEIIKAQHSVNNFLFLKENTDKAKGMKSNGINLKIIVLSLFNKLKEKA